MKSLEQTVFDNMLENLAPRLMFTRLIDAKITFNLSVVNDAILTECNNKKEYLITVPTDVEYDGEKISIHGNKRNKLAKEFFNRYNVDDILQLEKILILKKEEEQKQFELEQTEMKRIFDKEIYPLFASCQFEQKPKYSCWWGVSTPLIKFECRLQNPNNQWSDVFYIECEVFFDNHNLNKFTMKISELSEDKIHFNQNKQQNLDIQQIQKQCQNIIQKTENGLRIYNKVLQEVNKKQQKENQIWDCVVEICKDRKNVTILKKKNSFVAIQGTTKFSVGTGKCGKYYHTSINKIIDMIKNGYMEYYSEPAEQFKMRNDNELKELNWNKFEFISV